MPSMAADMATPLSPSRSWVSSNSEVAYFAQSVLHHFVDTQFGGAAKTVFNRAQDAIHIVPVAFELQNRVDDMFQYFGAGNAALLVDVTYEQHRGVRFFGKFQYGCGTFSDLGNASRGRFDVLRRDGLYGVDNDNLGLYLAYVGEYLFESRLAHDVAIGIVPLQAVGPHFQLASTLFARDIKDLFPRKAQNRLQDKRRFPDTGFPAYQYHGAGNEAAPQNAVELIVVQVDAFLLCHRNVVELLWFGTSRFGVEGSILCCCRFGTDYLLDIAVPFSA